MLRAWTAWTPRPREHWCSKIINTVSTKVGSNYGKNLSLGWNAHFHLIDHMLAVMRGVSNAALMVPGSSKPGNCQSLNELLNTKRRGYHGQRI